MLPASDMLFTIIQQEQSKEIENSIKLANYQAKIFLKIHTI